MRSTENRSANRLVALQFAAVALPLVLVLIVQTVADARRAAALEHSRPLRVLAQEARADYKTFVAGVSDAVDTGSLNSTSVEALAAAASHLGDLVKAGADPEVLKDAGAQLVTLGGQLPKGADLAALMKARDAVRQADVTTKNIADEFDRRDAEVMRGAITSAHRQQFAVTIAMVLAFVITFGFVRASQRRLDKRLDADRRVAEESLRIRNALDNCSVGIMVADPAGEVVYANRSVLQQVRLALPAVVQAGGTLEGVALTRLTGDRNKELAQGGRAELHHGERILSVSSDLVRSAEGQVVGLVLEWNDRTEQAALEREVRMIVDAAGRGEFDKRIPLPSRAANGADDFYAALAGGINGLLSTAETSLNDVAAMLESLARGDLTERIRRDHHGTFGKLKDYSNRTADRLEEIVGQIKAAADAIDSAAGDISGGTTELRERTAQQSEGVQSTARSMAEITDLVRGNGERAHQADQLATVASKVASDGGAVVGRIITTMNDIAGASHKIADIIGVIDSLAFQTNILALNAAVEAARAGDHGRGFAVVAAEVRSLAGRSAEAAREIRTLISASVDTVEGGTKLVDSAGHSMSEIVASIGRVSTIVREIAEASQHQTSGVEQVDRAITQVDEATRQNLELVDNASGAADSLKEQAAFLVDSMNVFRLQRDDGVSSARASAGGRLTRAG